MNHVFRFIKSHSFAIRLVVVVIIFSILMRTIDVHKIVAAYMSAKASFLIVAAVLMIPNILIQVYKWRFVLRSVGPQPSVSEATVSVLGGFFLGAATPGRTGEFARGAYLKKRSLLQTASLTVVDKGFNQAVVIIVGLVSVSFLLPPPYAFLALVADILVLSVLINIHRLKPFIERILHKYIHSAHVENALAAFDAFSYETVIGMIVYSISFYLLYAGQYYLMVLAFVDLPFLVALKTLPIVYLVNFLLPISFGDFGVKEMTSVYLLGQFGAPGEAVLGATLLNSVMTFFLPSAIGGVLTVMHRFSTSREARSSGDRTSRK